jgi:NADH dehydrogenase (ubiquinone) 1 alpha subcomplex subunit 9
LLTCNQEYDLRNTESIEEAVRHSDVVYNLVGRTYPTKYASRNRGRGVF